MDFNKSQLKSKLTIENFYIVCALLLGLIFVFIFTPWNTVDSRSHFAESYRISNLLLGKDEWACRSSDAEFIDEYFIHFGNHEVRTSGSWMCKDTSLVEYPDEMEHMAYYGILNYVPFVLALFVGRLVNLGIVPIMYLARIFALVFYVSLIYRAIKRTPIGKSILAFWSLVPMALQEIGAITYDSIVYVAAINFFVCVFVAQRDGLFKNRKNLIELFIWCALLGAVKGGGYAVLILFLVVLFNKERKNNLIVVALMLSSIIALVLSNYVLNPVDEFFQLSAEQSDKLQTSFMWEHPVQYLKLWANTVRLYYFVYFIQAIGSNLACSDFIAAIVPFIIFMPVSIFYCGWTDRTDETGRWTRRNTIVGLILLLIVFYVSPALVLRDNDVGTTEIKYCVGRYFRSILPLLFLILVNAFSAPKSTRAKEKIRLGAYALFVLLSVIVTVILINTYVL